MIVAALSVSGRPTVVSSPQPLLKASARPFRADRLCRRRWHARPGSVYTGRMSLERARRSIAQLRSFLGGGEVPVVRTSLGSLDPRTALELFESQLVCRLVD